MYLTRAQLQAALAIIEAPGTRDVFRCPAPRTDAEGSTTRQLKVRRDRTEPVPYGEHGADYLAIDPETGDVRCGACAGDADATVEQEEQS